MCADGLQLCEGLESSKYGAAQCYPRYDGGCQGSANTNCNPDTVWSSMPSGSDSYIRAYLNSGNWRAPVGEPYLYTHAFSVRCVLGLNTADGLQLCDRYESSIYGAAQCGPFYSGCQGALNNLCDTYWHWSSSSRGSGYYGGHALSGGVLYYNANSCGTGMYDKCSVGYAFSVRCVLDLTSVFHKIEKIQNADIFAAVRPS